MNGSENIRLITRFSFVNQDEPTLAEGQRVFWKYSGPIFTALMHFSLAGKYHPQAYPPILAGDTDRKSLFRWFLKS